MMGNSIEALDNFGPPCKTVALTGLSAPPGNFFGL